MPLNPARPNRLNSRLYKGLRIGLFGGSFNPPHEGHLHAAKTAMRALGLHQVWWLVSPGNPFKANQKTLPYAERLAACDALIGKNNPSMRISDLEQQLGVSLTADTIAALREHYPDTEFVFIAGADIVHELPKWHKWQKLVESISFCFIARPPATSIARRALWAHKNGVKINVLNQGVGTKAPLRPLEIYYIWEMEMKPVSSSLIRHEEAAQKGFFLHKLARNLKMKV